MGTKEHKRVNDLSEVTKSNKLIPFFYTLIPLHAHTICVILVVHILWLGLIQ